MAEFQPYLSLVVTARNDNHGGNLLRRMQIFVDGWIAQARRFNLPSELIVVEWNPPQDRARLWQDLKWPEDTSPCEVRFIEVPSELHKRYAHASALPLYQMIAKNVGIRRARGQFVVATNIDILFSDELVRFLARQELNPDRMYRIDRHDVMSDVPAGASIENQLAYCESHLLRLNTREGTFPLTPEGRRALAKRDIASPESNISFGRGWFAAETWTGGDVFRWMEREAEIELAALDDAPRVLRLDVEPGPSAGAQPILLEIFAEHEKIDGVWIENRCELHFPLNGNHTGVRRIFLHVTGGGLPVENDPRQLNLRAFSCRWIHSKPVKQLSHAPEEPSPITVKRESSAQRIARQWRLLQGIIGRVASEGPAITFTVPPSCRRIARFYIEYGGVSRMLPVTLLRFYRRFHFTKRVAGRQDIFDAVSGVRGSSGWLPREEYRGEIFRWTNSEGEILLPPTNGNSCTLLLQIEPGPGVGHKPFDLLVKDRNGEVVARDVVKRLSFLRIKIPRRRMAWEAFRLCAASEGIKGNADPRILKFRLFWCGVEDKRGGLRPSIFVHPAEGTTRAPVSIEGGAELIVTPPATPARALYLNIAAQTDPPEAITITDSSTGFIATHRLSAPQELSLELPLRPDSLAVFQIELAPPESTIQSAAFNWTPQKLPSSANVSENSQAQDSPATSIDAAISSAQTIAPRFLHTNGCGDFTLLSRNKWFELRGYPEFDLFSMNIDSIFCYAAHHGGAEEELLADPMRIYHIEHGTGSGWTPEGETELFARIRAKGLTFVSYSEVVGWAAQMRRLNCPFIFNNENWGLADFDLVDLRIGSKCSAQKRGETKSGNSAGSVTFPPRQ